MGNALGLVGIVIFGWIMGGLVEETLFRGYLMTNLARLFGERQLAWWWAGAVSSALIALPHGTLNMVSFISIYLGRGWA